MAEVLVKYDTPILDDAGRSYDVAISGAPAGDGLWEGWVEFTPTGGGAALRTPRETEQPDRSDLLYWATGLTASYLEGALNRALGAHPPDPPRRRFAAATAYEGPGVRGGPTVGPDPRPHAVLDPFEVYMQGEDVLRDELSALDEGHLRNIILAHRMAPGGEAGLTAMNRADLAEVIVEAVRPRES
jgi:hypothetical protein